nr:hypothetical protein [Tanacetum cinerariifolium]
MPDNELRSVSKFETIDSDDFHENDVSTFDHIVQDDYASAERLSLPDHMDHICEEVNSLHSRLADLESSIAQKVSNEIQSSLPTLREHKTAENNTPLEPSPETQRELAYKDSTLLFCETKVNKESAMVLYESKKKDLVDLTAEQDSEDDDDLDKLPLFKRFKIMHHIISKPQPLVKHFTDQLFGTTSSKFSPTPLREPTLPRDESKGKGMAVEEPPKDIMPFMKDRGSALKMPKIKSFITPEGTLTQEEFYNQINKMKRLAELKDQEKKSEEELQKFLNPATFKAQALK